MCLIHEQRDRLQRRTVYVLYGLRYIIFEILSTNRESHLLSCSLLRCMSGSTLIATSIIVSMTDIGFLIAVLAIFLWIHYYNSHVHHRCQHILRQIFLPPFIASSSYFFQASVKMTWKWRECLLFWILTSCVYRSKNYSALVTDSYSQSKVDPALVLFHQIEIGSWH